MSTRRNKMGVAKVGVAMGLIAMLASACSDKQKDPPDDGGDDGVMSHEIAGSSCADGAEEFRRCAETVLLRLDLSSDERDHLSSCDFKSAKAEGTESSVFEAARAAVEESCLSTD